MYVTFVNKPELPTSVQENGAKFKSGVRPGTHFTCDKQLIHRSMRIMNFAVMIILLLLQLGIAEPLQAQVTG